MQQIVYRLKYYWHVVRYNHSKAMMEDCLNEKVKADLRKKASYHERHAFKYNSLLQYGEVSN